MARSAHPQDRPDRPARTSPPSTGAGLVVLGLLYFALTLLWRLASAGLGWHADPLWVSVVYAATFAVAMIGAQALWKRFRARRP